MAKKVHIYVTELIRRKLKDAAEKKGTGSKALVEEILEEAIADPNKFKNDLKGNWQSDSDGTITIGITAENRDILRKQAKARKNPLRRYTPFLLKTWLESHGFASPR
jgi:hypothetical protein